MGTQFRIILYATDSLLALQAANEAFSEVDRLNDIFSDYDESSELSQLSFQASSGQKVKISVEMWRVLGLAQRLARKSKGAFDITIGPLSKLWRRAFRQQAFPDPERLKEAKFFVGYSNLKVKRKQPFVVLKKEGMRLDAGGIAKGYALDRAMSVLQFHGIDRALIDGGGDILVSKAPPETQGWRLETKRVNNLGQIEKITLFFENCAVATSGDTYRYLEWQGKRYSHIIDPRTGLGVSHEAMVSVQAPTGMLADALASTLSIIDPEKANRLLRHFDDCHYQMILPKEKTNIQFGKLNPIK